MTPDNRRTEDLGAVTSGYFTGETQGVKALSLVLTFFKKPECCIGAFVFIALFFKYSKLVKLRALLTIGRFYSMGHYWIY